ncbi:HAMP domain-containing histidine kinase [Aureisphaera sp. CAU 1614]|uniref:histidine kinase n=1 Tax=Halomarinibacterium sedimenti TaxID=2857106 RepID=A0A9X1JVL6_9FLAO|nr:HAMP domain-containing sensor histidine kinase [Halomarinibacterium sedimenti]MBW2937880.1 HAMP domain-containing histidine kinase [Halomarinibacterium sedimenti]
MFLRLPKIVTSLPSAIIITTVAIIGITGLDYLTGAELSFSIFYLIPLSLFALYHKSGKTSIVLFSILAGIGWFLVDSQTKVYTSAFYPIWNAFVRFTIFSSFGLLLYFYKMRQLASHEKNKQLNLVNTEKNKFLGMAAHDLRNPINGINTITNMLLQDPEYQITPPTKQMLELVNQLSNNMLSLIKNLLDVSKIESGHITLEKKSLDYVAFISEKITVHNLLAKRKHINIVLETQKPSLRATFDPNYIAEVLENLLSNAVKYAPNHTSVTVRVFEDPNTITTQVIDEGPGISPAEQQRLFRYFQTASSQPTAGEVTTGLGLAIAKKVITAHQGTIGVTSELGHGATFYYCFPKGD